MSEDSTIRVNGESRVRRRHSDGSVIWQSREDRERQKEAALQISRATGYVVHTYGDLDLLDWWATLNGRIAWVAEFKWRDLSVEECREKFGTVFLSLRKWLALVLVPFGHGVDGRFIVSFRGDLRWVSAQSVVGCGLSVAGNSARNRCEPVVMVPVDLFREVAYAPGG